MSRYDFASGVHGPAVVRLLLADRTAESAFGGDPALKKILCDKPFGERLEKGALLPADTEAFVAPLFAAFARKTDPSADSKAAPWKYLHWICAAYVRAAQEDRPVLAEDLSKIRADLADFEAFRTADGEGRALPPDRREITKYESYAALLETLRPFQQARDAKKAAAQKIDDRILAETTIVYEGPEGRIVIPHTKESCQFWGLQTRWCIAATKSENHFDRYNNVAPVYIYLPVASFLERERLPFLSSFKFAGTQGTVYNEHDQTVTCRLPCLDRLIGAAKAHLQTAKPGPDVVLENVKKHLETLTARAGRDGTVGVKRLKSIMEEITCPPATREHFDRFGSVTGLVPAALPDGGLWTDAGLLKKEMEKLNVFALFFAADSLREDRAAWLSLAGAGAPGWALHILVYCAAPALRNDPAFVRAVVDKCNDGRLDQVLHGAGDTVKNDPDFVQTVIGKQGDPDQIYRMLVAAGPDARNDLAVITTAINRPSGVDAAFFFRLAGECVRNNSELVIAAINRSTSGHWVSQIFCNAGPGVRSDRGVVLAAIAACGKLKHGSELYSILRAAGENVRNDPDVVFAAVKESGFYKSSLEDILNAAGDQVRADRGFLMKAYRQASADSSWCAEAVLETPSARGAWFFKTRALLRWDKVFPAKRPVPGAG